MPGAAARATIDPAGYGHGPEAVGRDGPWRKLQGALEADIVLVGAGLAAAAAALQLAERRCRVVVLDTAALDLAAELASGQVVAGLGLDPARLVEHFGAARGRAMAAFAGSAADLVFATIQRHAIACDAVRRGRVLVAATVDELEAVRALAAQWLELGAPVTLLDAAAVASRLGTDAFSGGLVDWRSGQLDPQRLADGLVAAATAAGALFRHTAECAALPASGANWQLRGAEGKIEAGQLVLLRPAGIAGLEDVVDPVSAPVLRAALATASLGDELERAALPTDQPFAHRAVPELCVERDAQRRLILTGLWPATQIDEDQACLALQASLHRLFPAMAGIAVQHRAAGLADLEPGELPRLMRRAPGLMTATGGDGQGVAAAFALGHLLAAALAGRAEAELPLPLFRAA